MHKQSNTMPSVHGTTSLGERGQIVVPKKLRDSLSLKKGDKFLVMEKDGAIILTPTQMMSKFVSHLAKHLKNLS